MLKPVCLAEVAEAKHTLSLLYKNKKFMLKHSKTLKKLQSLCNNKEVIDVEVHHQQALGAKGQLKVAGLRCHNNQVTIGKETCKRSIDQYVERTLIFNKARTFSVEIHLQALENTHFFNNK